jgi:hypothetical protein
MRAGLPLCLTVEFPASGLLFADFTAEHPGSSVDLLGEPVVVNDGVRYHPFVFLLQGADIKAGHKLERMLAQKYEPPATLRRDPWSGRWMGHMRMREDAIDHPAIQAWAPLADRFGPPWTHIEAGQYLMRAALVDPKQGPALAAHMKEKARLVGVEAQVELREISKHDFSVWDELVQASLGLTADSADKGSR